MKKVNTTTRFSPARKGFPMRYALAAFSMLILQFPIYGQQTSLPCNTFSPWVPATFTVAEDHSSPGLACWEGDLLCLGTDVPANVVNSNTSDFATGHITGIGSLTLSVKDMTNNYSDSNFVGFVISSGLFSLGLFSSVTITTYLEDVQQEDYQAVDLIGLSSSILSGPITVGFVTTTAYDEIEITIDNLLGIGDYNVHYAVNEKFCKGPDLICNIQTRMNKASFPMTIDYANTGSSGVSVAVVDNPENAISADTTDFASLIHVASVLGSSYLTVEEQVTDYPAGTFVGFDIENLTLTGVNVLSYMTVTSYLNGVQQQVVSGTALLAGVPLLSTSGRYTVGFVTNTDVDKIKITVGQPVGVTLGTTRVYSAIFKSLCEGVEPDCNINTVLTEPAYPVFIDLNQTGLTGAACGGCNIIESGDVIDNNPASYAQIIITAGVAAIGSLAVKDQLTDYPAGTFAGFRIENASLVGVNALTGITITTYLNGSFQEDETNAGALVSVGTDLLVNDDQQVVGFVTGLPFDEVKISLYNVGSVNIGTTRIHEVVITRFCQRPIHCDSTYVLNTPEFPVYIDAFRTGIDGVVCALCAVTNEGNVITPDTGDYGLIKVVAGVANTGSIAVADALDTYPAGTYAGFVIQDMGLLVEAQLFSSLTISTYNNGVLQEFKSGGQLIDLALIILYINDTAGRYNVGFKTTLPFDEIRITVGALANVINLIRVYGAFVDTRASNGGGLFCNNGPLANPDVATTPEDTPVIIDVLANDTDSDDNLGIPSVTDTPDHGTAVVNADSTITYTPNPNFVGPDAFIYTLCDPQSLCDTALVKINVLPRRDTLIYTIPEDTPQQVCVDDLPTVFSSPATSISLCSPPVNGDATVMGDCVLYEPDANFSGQDQFCVYVCHPDFPSICDTTIIIINVTPVNDAPLANPDVATTPEDMAVIIPVLANDSDPDNPLGTPVVTDSPDHGMTTVNGGGTITYTPDPDFVGTDHFIYTLCDPQPLCDTALVTVFVQPRKDTLIYTIPEDGMQQVCIDDLPTVFSDPATSISLCNLPAHGTANIVGTCVNYNPNPNFSGQDEVCVYVCHPDDPTLCDTTILIINVTPANDAPVANPDVATTPEDMPVVITVLANDSDSDNALGTPSVTTPPTHGMVTVNPGGTITYTPDPNYFGPDQFIYTICDPQPLCDTALVKITVSPVNDGPIANPDVATTLEDNPVVITVLANDSDVDNPLGTPSVTTPPTHGMVTVNPDGTITYTPDPNYFGPDQFIYTLCDPQPLCDTALVKITVTPVNDGPIANPDVATTPEDNPVIITVLANDSDVDNPLGTPSVTTPPTHGMVTVNAGGTITYTPNPNYFGPDQFIYTLCDPGPLCDTALVKITVTPVNDGPVANPDVATTPEDNPVIITVLANDSDVDNPLGTPSVTTPPTHGMVTVNPGGTITYTPDPNYFGPDQFIYTLCDPQPLCDTALVKITVSPVNDGPVANPDVANTPEDMPVIIPVLANDSDPDNPLGPPTVSTPPTHGMVTVNPDGTITYTPNPDYVGPDQFIYTICDPQPLCDTALVKINVGNLNDPPIANPDVASTTEDNPVIITVLANDSDPDDPLGTPTVSTPPTHGMVTVNAGGTITYTPNPNYSGPDQFIYTLCDPQPLCDTALVKITVTPVNDGPIANPDVATTPEDNPVIITVLVNDSDPDNPLGTPSVTTPPTHGMVTVNAGGTITYTPNPNYFGPDQFIYTICDPAPLCDTALVKINVTPVNDGPLANPDVATTPEDNPVIITVLANDSDPDNPLGPPVVTTPPTHGMVTVNAGGTITYTPNPNYFGPDQFIYTICDPAPLCDTALVKINVTPVNDGPLANPDVATTPEDNPVVITALANDSDPDNPLGPPVVTTPPTHGMVTVNAGGTITYTPNPNYFGPDQFIYTICDPAPLCDTALVKITVSPVNDGPLANPDVATTPEDMPIVINVLANDSDPDNTVGPPTVTDPPDHGMTSVNPDGTITYTPDPDYVGPDQFIYTICDPQPLCDTAIVHINVSPAGPGDIFLNCPVDLVMQCGSGGYVAQINTWIGTATASGGCTGTTTISTDYNGSSTPSLSCNLSSGLPVKFTATDQCGNTTACTKTVYLDDTAPPQAVAGEIESCYNSMGEAIAAAISATGASDNCASSNELIFTSDVAAGPFCDSILTITVSDQCGNSSSVTYQTMINCQTIRLKVYFEGPYSASGDSMTTTLNSSHTLPGQTTASPFIHDEPAGQPYQGAPWYYNGNLGLSYGDGAGKIPYPSDVVDWVLVTVRHEGIMPANNIWTCAGWVHKDGNVTFPEDCPGPAINVNDDYYLLVQHRNHLGILSPSFTNILCNGTVLEWDFRTSDSYKTTFRVGQKQVETGVWAMFDGNGDQLQSIGAINSADRTLWITWQGYLGYSPGDYDMNIFTSSGDETTWKINQNRTTAVVFY